MQEPKVTIVIIDDAQKHMSALIEHGNFTAADSYVIIHDAPAALDELFQVTKDTLCGCCHNKGLLRTTYRGSSQVISKKHNCQLCHGMADEWVNKARDTSWEAVLKELGWMVKRYTPENCQEFFDDVEKFAHWEQFERTAV